jgi:DNA-binding transcriptional LysR family regulator
MVKPVAAAAVSPDTKNAEQAFGGVHWDDLDLLLNVIKMGSFHRAANALGLTQPTVSRRIARLEAALGTSLVNRQNNGATLTVDGRVLLEDLGIAKAAIERIRDRSRGKQTLRDDVKIVMTDGLATYWLPHFLPYFFNRYPNVELRIQVVADTKLRSSDQFDMSIHFLQPTDPDMLTTRLGTLHFLPYASAGYLEKHGTPYSISDLGHHRLLDTVLYLIDKGSWRTRLPDNVGDGATQLFTNSSGALAEAVRQGAGIALLPTYGSLFQQGLVPLELNLHYETMFWLCYRKTSAERAAVRAAVEFFKHIFNQRTMPWFSEHYVAPKRFAPVTVEDIMRTFTGPEERVTPFKR